MHNRDLYMEQHIEAYETDEEDDEADVNPGQDESDGQDEPDGQDESDGHDESSSDSGGSTDFEDN